MNRSNHWRRCSAKIDILQNSCSTEYPANCVIRNFEKFKWRGSIFRNSHLRCSVKRMFLEIAQTQENTSARDSFLIKLQAKALLKKILWNRCFPMNFAKFLRTLFFTERLWTTASKFSISMWRREEAQF